MPDRTLLAFLLPLWLLGFVGIAKGEDKLAIASLVAATGSAVFASPEFLTVAISRGAKRDETRWIERLQSAGKALTYGAAVLLAVVLIDLVSWWVFGIDISDVLADAGLPHDLLLVLVAGGAYLWVGLLAVVALTHVALEAFEIGDPTARRLTAEELKGKPWRWRVAGGLLLASLLSAYAGAYY